MIVQSSLSIKELLLTPWWVFLVGSMCKGGGQRLSTHSQRLFRFKGNKVSREPAKEAQSCCVCASVGLKISGGRGLFHKSGKRSMSRIASIDSVEHAALVLKSLRKSSSQSRYGAGGGVSLGAFDELVSKTAQELSERVKMEQRMESLIAQDPALHAASHSPALVLHQSKDLNTPLELSPGKYKAMFKASRIGADYMGSPPLMLDAANEKRGKHRRDRIGGGSSSNNNNNNDDDDGDIDFSSDDEDDYPSGLHGSGGGKLERVALNRPTKSGAKASGRTRNDEEDDDDDAAAMRALALEAGMDGGSPSAKSSSFYDAEETLDSDDEDNAALFKGFTAPTIRADSEFAAQLSKASPSPHAALSLRGPSQGSVGGSFGGTGVGSGGASGMRVAKPPAVPATNTTKELTSRGVVVGKGGIFIRAGGRRKGGVT